MTRFELRVPAILAGMSLLLAACVTINVYFPAAAAERAADKIIDDVWGTGPATAPTLPVPPSSSTAEALWLALADFLMPAAQAQEPNLDLSSPEIKRLSAAMEARHSQLAPYYASGAVGLTADGYIALRDANAVALADRNPVRALVANENADRAALYREMATANQQPQWEAQIRSVFAKRWIARAQAGWYYQDASGAWVRK